MTQNLGSAPELAMTNDDAMVLLRVENLNKHFGNNQVLRNLCLSLNRGEIRGLVGQNGSGKSTLIKILSGYYSPDPGGRVILDGRQTPLPISIKGKWLCTYNAR